jgi:hypothetical protein
MIVPRSLKENRRAGFGQEQLVSVITMKVRRHVPGRTVNAQAKLDPLKTVPSA